MAIFSLAAARPRLPVCRAAARARPGTRLGSQLGLLIGVILLLSSGTALPREIRVQQIAAPLAFPLLDWHLDRLVERAPQIGAGLLGVPPSVTTADQLAAASYFAARPADRAPLAQDAEIALEHAVGSVLLDEGLATNAPWAPGGNLLFPPVVFTFTKPPEVLIVSRRDRVAVVQSELLRPGMKDTDAEQLEAAVDSLDYSSLVTPIGGLATYPTMVPEGSRPLDAAIAVAHEWVHGYLFFTPLGKRYWSSQDARTINETAADMVSRELGRRITQRLDLDTTSPARTSAPRPSDVQFRAMMRETRVKLDAFLKAGQVDAAEAYLRDRREDFVAAGFEIRKLNQAYFAFYGSYGDGGGGAAGINPIARQLGWLRAASGSPGEFLRRVGQLTGAADLARLVGE